MASRSAHVITRAEMARRLVVSRAAVTRACREGGRLAPAVSGKGVNVLHEAARRWIAERAAARVEVPPDGAIPVDDDEAAERVAPPSDEEVERLLAERTVRRAGAAGDGSAAAPYLVGRLTELDELAEPLTTLTETYGDAPSFASWVKCRKALEEARRAEMLRARIEGRLVARTTVIRMIDHVDVAFRLLLSDAPRTIATRLSAPDMPAATAMIRDVMSQALAAARDHMAASLDADDPMAPLAEAAE